MLEKENFHMVPQYLRFLDLMKNHLWRRVNRGLEVASAATEAVH